MSSVRDEYGDYETFWAELYNAHEADDFDGEMIPLIQRLLAEAWDEGVEKAACNCGDFDGHPGDCAMWGVFRKNANPYRGSV